MTRHALLCLSASLLLSVPAGSAPQAAGWKAGAARVRITPPQLMWMSGYGSRTKPAEGTLTDLWAKALVLEDPSGRRCVLVTLDLVGIGRELSRAICSDLEKRYRLPRQDVILACSHTHTGPVVGRNLHSMYQLDARQQKLVADYADDLERKVVQVVGEALKGLAPARLEWGSGTAGFAVNRRNNKEKDVPMLRAAGKLKGPVDHQVPVLAVRDPSPPTPLPRGERGDRKEPLSPRGRGVGVRGKLRAVVFGYACHATVLSFYRWSGDYPAFAQAELEKAHAGAVALFWAGCGGDQNPLPRRKVELAEKYGKELAAAVEAVLVHPMKPIAGTLATSYAEIPLAFGDLPSREQLVKDSASANRYVASRARTLLKQLEAKGSLRGRYPYPVQAWRLGTGPTLLALGGEVVVDYALRLKKELGEKNTWVMAYANDVMAYIPSLRVLKEGGYEGGGAMLYYGLPAPWSPRVEEHIVKAAHEQAGRVRRPAPAPKR